MLARNWTTTVDCTSSDGPTLADLASASGRLGVPELLFHFAVHAADFAVGFLSTDSSTSAIANGKDDDQDDHRPGDEPPRKERDGWGDCHEFSIASASDYY